jgi:hypothetical protein
MPNTPVLSFKMDLYKYIPLGLTYFA